MADNKDPVLKFLVDIGVDPKKFTKEVRAALQEAAKFIRSQNNYITAASREAFERAGKEAAKSYYKGFNSIKPQYKVQGPTSVPASRSAPRRTTSTPTAPTELPSPPPPIAAPPSRATTAQDQAALAAINARIDAELRAIEVRELAAQRVKELAAQEAAAERKAVEQKIKDTQRELAARQKAEAARARAIAQEAAAQQRQAAAREAAIRRELAADARLVASIDRNRQMQEKRQQQLLQREIAMRERAAKAAEKQAAQQTKAVQRQAAAEQKASRDRLREYMKMTGLSFQKDSYKKPAAQPADSGNIGALAGALNKSAESIGKVVAGVTGLIASLQVLFDIYTRVTDAAIAYTKAQFQLEVSVRANQRLYGEQAGTIAQWRGEVERLRTTYGVFSRQDLTAAVAQVQSLTRQYGFTREQTTQLLDVSAQLAELYNTPLSDALSQATSFLQGNSRALEQYSIDASESSFKTQAMKDKLLQLGQGWDSLSDADKALARFNFLLGQTAPLADDAAKAQDTLQGRLQQTAAQLAETRAETGQLIATTTLATSQLQVTWEQLIGIIIYSSLQMGAVIVAAWNSITQVVSAAIQRQVTIITGSVNIAAQGVAGVIKAVETGGDVPAALQEMFEKTKTSMDILFGDTQENLDMTDDLLLRFKANLAQIQEGFGQVYEALGDTEKALDPVNSKLDQTRRIMSDIAGDAASDVEEILSDDAKARAEAARDFIEAYRELMQKRFEDEARAAREHGERLAELDRELAEGREEAARDYWDRIGEIEHDGAQEREEAARDYAQDLIELERDLAKDRQDAARDYSDRIADIDREEARRVAEIDAERHREREREEEDHQRELQRIRERYAIQIDEAVQRRDARAILNLQRQRAQDLKEAEEDFGTRRRREDEDAEERKRKAREEADERRADAKRDYDRRLRDLEEAEAEKRRELREGYERELEDQKRSEAEKRAETLRDYQRKMEDLQRSNAQKRQELQRDYAQQLADMRQASLQQETELRNSYIRRKADLEAALREQFVRLGKHWADTGKLNADGAKYITDVLNYHFGLGGLADYIMQGFIARAKGRMEIEVRTSGFTPGATQQGGSASNPPGVPAIPGSPYGGNRATAAPATGGTQLVVLGPAARSLAGFGPTAQADMFAGQSPRKQEVDVDLRITVDGKSHLFSPEFEDRVTDVIADVFEQQIR